MRDLLVTLGMIKLILALDYGKVFTYFIDMCLSTFYVLLDSQI